MVLTKDLNLFLRESNITQPPRSIDLMLL